MSKSEAIMKSTGSRSWEAEQWREKQAEHGRTVKGLGGPGRKIVVSATTKTKRNYTLNHFLISCACPHAILHGGGELAVSSDRGASASARCFCSCCLWPAGVLARVPDDLGWTLLPAEWHVVAVEWWLALEIGFRPEEVHGEALRSCCIMVHVAAGDCNWE